MTRGRLRILAGGALVIALLIAPTACSKSRSPSVGGETNWLLQCSADEPCETGSCLCGVCTVACDDDARCAGDFEGSCTATDDGAGAQLCGSNARRPAPAVCLPRCSSDDACGGDYACQQGVCVPATPGSGGPPDAGGRDGSVDLVNLLPDGRVSNVIGVPFPDGGPSEDRPCNPFMPDAGPCELPTAMNVAPLLDMLAESKVTWNALRAANQDTYWYTEENCGPSGLREGTLVQVFDGVASGGRIELRECRGSVNRAADFDAAPFDELYDRCDRLVRDVGVSVDIRIDERGVLASCTWAGPAGCADGCGEGFLIIGWGFGQILVP